jgi:hypothetical protein
VAVIVTLGFDSGELKLYARHVMGLIRPAHRVKLVDTYGSVQPGDVTTWTDAQVQVLAQEGRRQLDSLTADFERIRERGKYIFTTALALITGAVGLTARISGRSSAISLPWYFGLLLLTVGFLGATSVFVLTAELGTIDTVLLSYMSPVEDFDRSIAVAYAKAVRHTANARNNRFTVLRDSVWFTVIGAVIELAVWLALNWS